MPTLTLGILVISAGLLFLPATTAAATTAAATTAAETTAAETVYVNDMVYVTIRSGQSSEHRIKHRGIPSGTSLIRLEENTDSGYSRVRMENGLEGWIQSHYLVTEPIARDLLEGAREELLVLKVEHQKTLLRLQDTEEVRDLLQNRIDEMQAEQEKAQQEKDQDPAFQYWYFGGAGTVLISLLIGFFTARRIYLKRGIWT